MKSFPITGEELGEILSDSSSLTMKLAAVAADEWRSGTSTKAIMAALVSALTGFVGAAKAEGEWVKEEDDSLLSLLLKEAFTFIEGKETEVISRESH